MLKDDTELADWLLAEYPRKKMTDDKLAALVSEYLPSGVRPVSRGAVQQWRTKRSAKPPQPVKFKGVAHRDAVQRLYAERAGAGATPGARTPTLILDEIRARVEELSSLVSRDPHALGRLVEVAVNTDEERRHLPPGSQEGTGE